MRTVRATLFWIVFHVAALVPLFLLIWDYTQGQVTANPIREIQLRTGRTTLLFLTLTLACTPIYNLTGFRQVILLRRPLGLYTFAYASLHLLNFIGVDYHFDFSLLWTDISEKRYIIAGLATFLILLALAITSTRGWMRRLGRNWERLHSLIYVAGILAVLHYFWQLKVTIRAPFIYGIVIILLLILRMLAISRFTSKRIMWPRKQ
jgi:sulfoxide reductase heme-binding subunit YedZ